MMSYTAGIHKLSVIHLTNISMFEDAKLEDKVKELKGRVKDLLKINKTHQTMNGNMHKEIEDLKKNETLLREDLQAKDLELGRLYKKLQH